MTQAKPPNRLACLDCSFLEEETDPENRVCQWERDMGQCFNHIIQGHGQEEGGGAGKRESAREEMGVMRFSCAYQTCLARLPHTYCNSVSDQNTHLLGSVPPLSCLIEWGKVESTLPKLTEWQSFPFEELRLMIPAICVPVTLNLPNSADWYTYASMAIQGTGPVSVIYIVSFAFLSCPPPSFRLQIDLFSSLST